MITRTGKEISVDEVDITTAELNERKFRFNETFKGMNAFLQIDDRDINPIENKYFRLVVYQATSSKPDTRV